MLTYGKIAVDTDSCTVMYDRKIIKLHPKEYSILMLFLKHPNHILTYDVIIDKLWDLDKTPAYSSIRSHIKSIRKAFAQANANEEVIETVHGMGYRLNPLIKNSNELIPGRHPSISVLENFLKAQAIEYLVLDPDFRIKYVSPNLQKYCDYPTSLRVGIHAGEPFPELIGFEKAFEKVRNKEDEKFEIKGIARASNPNRPDYINFCVIADDRENQAQQSQSFLFVFFEDVSEHMIYKQRCVQQENEPT
jgi:DNA-binding winged helix-turn-helix (wHTH) protein